MVLPKNKAPFKESIAFWAADNSFIFINPNPLDSSVNLSITILAEVTSPYSEKKFI